eukprot:CAMPEP_0180810168 /NCGR_PEP_ID=MMETSP1038_2-20121128/64734_1 /TAXON_ID=632150 /ORGANISM="Azadinium spinosum, Strain 3D9" /LENGTH=41 /DNA_ID= /DNA_START= /DNA_END= /DNA_ORIENTATION=
MAMASEKLERGRVPDATQRFADARLRSTTRTAPQERARISL